MTRPTSQYEHRAYLRLGALVENGPRHQHAQHYQDWDDSHHQDVCVEVAVDRAAAPQQDQDVL